MINFLYRTLLKFGDFLLESRFYTGNENELIKARYGRIA